MGSRELFIQLTHPTSNLYKLIINNYNKTNTTMFVIADKNDDGRE